MPLILIGCVCTRHVTVRELPMNQTSENTFEKYIESVLLQQSGGPISEESDHVPS
jgi:hypothetical protein